MINNSLQIIIVFLLCIQIKISDKFTYTGMLYKFVEGLCKFISFGK